MAIDRFLAVPVLDGERLAGGIFLANKEKDYTDEDLALLQRIGALYAIALQRKDFENEREKLILEYQAALAQVKQLSGLLPICSSCKKVRDDKGYWTQIEEYISEHSEADFSHGLCPGLPEETVPGPKKIRKRPGIVTPLSFSKRGTHLRGFARPLAMPSRNAERRG